MAIIVCPKCGKNSSNTNEKCFHCGFNLRLQSVEPVQLQRYIKLPSAEQERLRKEYYSLNPKYESYMKKRDRFIRRINITAIVTGIFSALYILLWIVTRIIKAVTKASISWALIPAIIFGVIWVIAIIANVVLRKVTYRKYRRNDLIIEKKYQKWLKEEKQIEYIVSFTTKQRKDKEYFDKINIQKKDIEV